MTTRPTRPLILIVEDDVHGACGLARMLTDDGFDVERVADGASAIARLSRCPLPDALVTDYFMPYADGLSVARFAQSRCPTMTTVVVTGHAELIDRFDPLAPKPTILVKPVDYDALTRTLRSLLPAAA